MTKTQRTLKQEQPYEEKRITPRVIRRRTVSLPVEEILPPELQQLEDSENLHEKKGSRKLDREVKKSTSWDLA